MKPGAVVWKGDRELPVTEQGVKVLGVPIGTPEYVQEFLAKKEGSGAENFVPKDSVDERSSGGIAYSADVWIHTC